MEAETVALPDYLASELKVYACNVTYVGGVFA